MDPTTTTEKDASDETKPKSEDPVTGTTDDGINDAQKKIRRAERFGMPVKLSEQDKRNSRAERLFVFYIIVWMILIFPFLSIY